MNIESIRVQNFRCIRDATLYLDTNLTALIGSNGTGKSCFLIALAIFFQEEDCHDEDFFGNDFSNSIQISITFNNLGKKEQIEFSSYVKNEKLTVTQVIEYPLGKDSVKFYGTRLSNPDFEPIRKAPNATETRKRFEELSKLSEYKVLGGYIDGRIALDKVLSALERWEQENPNGLVPINDNGQFFGYKQVGGWKIGKYCKFVYIPASGDITKIAVDGKRSPISLLLDISVRSVLSSNTDLNVLREKVEKEYDEIIKKSMSSDLKEFNNLLSSTFGSFAPGNSLEIDWNRDGRVTISDPIADVKIIERGFPTNIQGAGDGSKRALIMTLLQHLAMIPPAPANDELNDEKEGVSRGTVNENNELSRGLIIAIEEPELFQHPGRQRTISKFLHKLSSEGIKGVSDSNQVIFSTHSPILLDIDRFEQIRLVRKEARGARYGETVIVSTTLRDVNKKILGSMLKQDAPNEEKEKAQLSSFINPEVNEGFFSDMVVLVEGEEDKTALQCTAKIMGYDFDIMNIKIVPCGSKNSIPKAYAVFELLSIPTYTIWDSDTSNNCTEDENCQLQRLVGARNIIPYPETIEGNYACFKESMTTVLENEVPNYAKIQPQISVRLKLRKKNEKKNPLFIRILFEEAYTDEEREKGIAPMTIKKVVSQIRMRREKIL